VVNDAFTLDGTAIADLANRTADLLRERGGSIGVPGLETSDVTMTTRWLGSTYGDVTPPARSAVGDAAAHGLTLEPVYTGKAVAAMRDVGGTPEMAEPILWLNTHGPR
jgi:D-cysteine desulfhydrase